MKMIKKLSPSLSSLESDGNTSFLRAARAGHLDKVLEHLKQNIDINTSNSNGLNALHLASKDGHVEVVKELLSRGAAVDAATKKGNTALHIASLAGQEEVVKLLIQSGASVNVQSQNGFTPLYMAAQENHDNVVKYLLANGANQSLATEDGFTPLAVAMQQGHEKVVTVLLENDTRGKVRLPALHIAAKKDDVKAAKLLLENDHNPDVTSKSGFTPLHIASHYGNESIANLLIQKGADVNYAAKHNISPLHVAAKWGKTNMVALLIERGANIEAKTRDGLTPLHCAARSGHEQVVDMLLEKGAPISSKTKNGLAPLHMAAQGDHVDAARILLYHRAPVDEVTVDYLTALHVAAHCGHVRVAKLLLDRGADANARALNGFTPLHIACKKNRIKVVELLLKHGASIEATTESGLTPLHVASFMGCMNIVIYLLQHNANPDVPTVRGETPLHLAARANQTDIIRILLRNGANVDARAREQQTPLHIASRLGNVDIVMLLLQHGAKVDTTTKDMYTALHIASKEGQDEVAAILIDNGASVNAVTKKGFTSLHLAAKYGHIKVAKLLLQKEAAVDAQGKNGVTPLHVASHYDHQNVALLLLDKGASPHAAAKNGHTPLHIAAKKNQMDIANTLLEYGADPNTESKAGFTPLHLSAQEGHDDMSSLLLEHKANPNSQAKNGLTPMHLCAQEDRVPVAEVLTKAGADVDCQTKSGYTPLHIACHYGQINMVRFLINKGASVKSATNLGYTPLHQAAQQGHTLIVNILLKNKAPPNAVTVNGQTPLNIAQKLGYISVIETLKVVTETTVTTTTVTTIEEKYRVVAPEAMQETFMSDSEEEGGEDTVLADHAYRYLTADEMKSLGDDSLPIDVTRDEKIDSNKMATSTDSNTLPPQAIDESISPQHINQDFIDYARKYTADNMDILKQPINIGFLVSFLVDARGGAMRGCRHSGVRIIVPPQCAASPTRITCRYVRPQRTPHPPPLMEGEALASRVLELGPVGAKFLGPVIIEVPHFAALRGKEREIVILRSDNGETWREHTIEAADEIMNDVLNKSFEEDDLHQLEDPSSGRITRIVTNDFPQYFAVVTRIHQEVHAIGPEGGMVSSTVVPQVQAVFPQGALTKKIKVGLQAQPIDPELTAKLLGHGVAVSPVVTVEPRRRKFHKAITLSMPAPRAHSQGMINQYSGSAPTLRLLCSITGGTTRAQWEDVTGSTPLTFVNDCVSFTTTVSARFWLMDCRNIGDATKMATELYREAIHVPFMAKFVVFAKRVDPLEARLRVFCMTDDKEDKTLEQQEHFTEVAKSRDVEVLEGKPQYIEFSGNLVPITKSGEQLQFSFRAFRENRLPFSVRVKDQHAEAIGRCLFMREPKVAKGDPPQQPICILNIVLPDDIVADTISLTDTDSYKKSGFLHDEFEYYMPDPRISDMSNLLGEDWVPLAAKLGLTTSEINVIKSEYPDSVAKQAQSMLRMWRAQTGHRGHSNILESALKAIGREDIIQHCLRIEQSNISRKEDQITDNNYYEKETIMKGIENEIIRTKVIKEDDYKKDENYETKYSAEEKAIEESDDEETFKKSVIERRHVIERKMSSDRTVPSSQRIEIVQEISSIKSLVEDKVAEAEEKQKTIIIKPYTAKSKFDDLETKKMHDEMTNKQIDLKNQRDEKLLEGVSQRLEEEEKLTSICTNDDPYSPKSSKTPPPSPADFILKERASAIQEKDKADVPQQQQEIVQIKDEKTGLAFESTNENQQTIFNDLSYVKTKTLEFIDNEAKFEPPLNAESAAEKIEKKKHKKGILGTLKMIVGKSSDSESEPESISKTKVEKKKVKEGKYNKKYGHGKKPRMPTPPPELSAEEVTSNDENDLSKTEKPIEKKKEKEILAQTSLEQQTPTHGKSKDSDKVKESEERKTSFFNLFTKKEKKDTLHSDQIYSKEFQELLQRTRTFVDTELNNYECGQLKQPLQIEKVETIVPSAKAPEERKGKDTDKTKDYEEKKAGFFNLFGKKEKKDPVHIDETYSKEFKELLQNTKTFVDNELINYESGKPKQVHDETIPSTKETFDKSKEVESVQTKKDEIIPSTKDTEERKISLFNLFGKKEKRDSSHAGEVYSEEFKELLKNTKSFVNNELQNYESGPIDKQHIQTKAELTTIPTEKIISEVLVKESKEPESAQSKKDELSTKETEEQRKLSFFNLFGKKEKRGTSPHAGETYTEEFKGLLQNTHLFVNNELLNYESGPIEKQHLQSKTEVIAIPTEEVIKEVHVKEVKESESAQPKKEKSAPSTKEAEERKSGFFSLFSKKEKRDSSPHPDETYSEEFKELLQNTTLFVNNELQNYESGPIEKQHLQSKTELITIPTEKIIKEVHVKESRKSESPKRKKDETTPSTKESEERKGGFFNLFGKKGKRDSSHADDAYTEEFKELLHNTKSFVNNELQNYESGPVEKQHPQSKTEVVTIPTETIIKEVRVKESKESESAKPKKDDTSVSTKETEERKISFFNLFGKKEKRDSLHGHEAYTEEFKELLQNTTLFVNNELQNYESGPSEKHHLQSKTEAVTIPTEKVHEKEKRETESAHPKKDDAKESEERKLSFFNLFGKKEKRDSSPHPEASYSEEFKQVLQNTNTFVNNELQNYESGPTEKPPLQTKTQVITIPAETIIEKVHENERIETESAHPKKDGSRESEERKLGFFNLFGKKDKLGSSPHPDESYSNEFKQLLQNTKSFVNNELQNYESGPTEKPKLETTQVIQIPTEKIFEEVHLKEYKESESAQLTKGEPSAKETEERKSGFFNLFSKKEKRDSSNVDEAYAEEFKELLQNTNSFVNNELQNYESGPTKKQHVQSKTEVIIIPTEKIIEKVPVKESKESESAQPKKDEVAPSTKETEEHKISFFNLFSKIDKRDSMHDDKAYTEEFKELLQKTKSFVDNEFQNYEHGPIKIQQSRIEEITIPTEKLKNEMDLKEDLTQLESAKTTEMTGKHAVTKRHADKDKTRSTEQRKSGFFGLFGKKDKKGPSSMEAQLEKETVVAQTPEIETTKLKKEEIDELEKEKKKLEIEKDDVKANELEVLLPESKSFLDTEVQNHDKPELVQMPRSISSVLQTETTVELLEPQGKKTELQKPEKPESVPPLEKKSSKEDQRSVEQKKGGFLGLFGKKDKKETPKPDKKSIQHDASIDDQPKEEEERDKEFKLLPEKTSSFLNTELTNYETPLPILEKSKEQIDIDLQNKPITEIVESIEEEIYEQTEYQSVDKRYEISLTRKINDDNTRAIDDTITFVKETHIEKQPELSEIQETDKTQTDLETLLKETATFVNTEIAFRSNEIPPKAEQLLTPVKETVETMQTEIATTSEDESKSQSSRESSPKKSGFLSLFKKAKKEKAHKSKSKELEKSITDAESSDQFPVADPMAQVIIDENKEKVEKEITHVKDILVEEGSGQKDLSEVIADGKILEAQQIAAQAISDTDSFLTEEQLAVSSSISKPAITKELRLKEQSSELDDSLKALTLDSIDLNQEIAVNLTTVKRDIEEQKIPNLEVSVKPILDTAEDLKVEVKSAEKEFKEDIKSQEEALKSQVVQEHKDSDKKQEARSKSPKKDSEDRKSGLFSFFGKKSKSKGEQDVDSNLKDVSRDTNDFINTESVHYDKPEDLKETVSEHREIAPKSVTFSLDETKQPETETIKVTNGECTTDTNITSKDSEANEKEKGSEEKKGKFLGSLFGKKDKKHKKSREIKEEDLLKAGLIKKSSTTETDHPDSEHILEKDTSLKEVNFPDSTELKKEDDVFLETLSSTKSFLDTENQNYDDSSNVQAPLIPAQTIEEHEEKGKHGGGGILKIITDKISKISPSKSSKADAANKKLTEDVTLSKEFQIEATDKDIVATKIDDVESLTAKFKQLKDKTEETKEEISGMVTALENIRHESTLEKYANEADHSIKQIDSAIDKQIDKAENLMGATKTTIDDHVDEAYDYTNVTFENLKKEFEKVKESTSDALIQGKIENIKDEYSTNIGDVGSELVDTAQYTVSSLKDSTIQQAKQVDENVKDIQTEYFRNAAELDSIINKHLNISDNLKQLSTSVGDKVEDGVKKSDQFIQDSKKIPSQIDSAIEKQLQSVKDTALASAATVDQKIGKQKQDLRETAESIKTTVDDKIKDISEAKVLHEADKAAKQAASTVGSIISSTVTEKRDDLEETIQASKDKIATETISKIQESIVDTKTEIAEGIQGVGDSLKQTKESINDKIKGGLKSVVQEIETPLHDTKQVVDKSLHDTKQAVDKSLHDTKQIVDKSLHKVQETGTTLIEQDKWKEIQDLKEQFEQKLEEIPQIELKAKVADVFEDELKQVKEKGKDAHDTTQETLVHFQEEFIKDFEPTQFIEKEQPHKVLSQVYVSPKSSKKLPKEPEITNKESDSTNLSAIKSEIEDSVNLIHKSLAELEVKAEDLTPTSKKEDVTTPSQKRKPMFRLESEDEDVGSAADAKGFDFPKYTMETLHEKQTDLKDKVTKSIDEKLENIDKALQSLEEIEQMHTEKTIEPKLHRVERKFERMASEILEKEAEEAQKGAVTSEELENKREKEFNRFVSQISTEEMSIFQNEYSSLCTEEIDSLLVDADVGPPGSQDNFKGDVVYMAPVKFNENNSINKAGIEVNVIPIMRSPCTSPLPLPKPDQNLSRPQSDLGFYNIKRKKGGSSLPDLQRSTESLYSSHSGIVESILEIGPEKFLIPPSPKYTRTASEECLSSEHRVNSTPKPYDSNDCLPGSLTQAVTSWLSQSSLFSNESKLSTDSEISLENKNREKSKKSRKKNAKRQPCTLDSSPLGESLDHPQSSATVKQPDTTVKGDESKQTKEGKKDKQVKDQHKLSDEMEELLEAMKEVGKK